MTLQVESGHPVISDFVYVVFASFNLFYDLLMLFKFCVVT